MALVTRIGRVSKERQGVHGEVECDCSIFKLDGETYIQLDTYGSDARKLHGKISQSLQFNRASALALRNLLDEILK